MIAETITPEEESNINQDLKLAVDNPDPKPVTTQTRAEVSRRNGRLSRGPISPEGKARSRLNAIKHGLFCTVSIPMWRQPGLPGQKDYDTLVDQLTDAFNPKSQLEVVTISSLALELLKSRLLQELELSIFRSCFEKSPDALPTYSTYLTAVLPEVKLQQVLEKNTDEIRSEIESLSGMLRYFNTGKTPELTQDAIDQMAKTLWKKIWNYTRIVRDSQEELRQIEVQLASSLPRKERSRLIKARKETKRSLAVDIEIESRRGPSACGVTSADDVAAVIKGEHILTDAQRQPLREIISGYLENLRDEMELHQRKEQSIANARQDAANRLIEKMPAINLFGQYAAMIRKNIDRCLKILRDAGGDRANTIDVGSFLQK